MDYKMIKTVIVSVSVTLNIICAYYFFCRHKRKKTVIYNPPKISRNSTKVRGPSNLLQFIPTNSTGVFTFEDVVNARTYFDMSIEGTGKLISKWIGRGHIKQIKPGVYKKLKREHMVTIQEDISAFKGK